MAKRQENFDLRESTDQDLVRAVPEHESSRPAPIAIPTGDPQAALLFCQRLAGLLQAAPELLQHSATPALGAVVPEWPAASSWLTPEISVIIPIYNEQDNLPTLHTRLTAVLGQTGLDYEIIFVDDGSRDQSRQLLSSLAEHDPHILVLELARNFGHQVAISAGLDHSRGRGVIVMDGDLQDPPEVLPDFIAKWREGYDVVYAIRAQRKEIWPKRIAYAAFYRTLRRVASIEIPLDSGDFCIMDRRVVDLMLSMPERNRFVRGIRSWVGLRQTGLAYERHSRYAGKPKYTLTGLIYLALDGLISFSYVPLRLITLLGFGISLFSMLMALFYFVKKLTVGLNPPGFATLIVAILFLAGIQLITIGVIGEYVGRIFEEVKRRPLYVIRRVVGGEQR